MLFLKIILIISIFLILIITVKVEVKIQNIKYNSEKVKGECLANNYQIIIKILTLEGGTEELPSSGKIKIEGKSGKKAVL